MTTTPAINELLDQAHEILERITSILVEVEKCSATEEHLATLYREMHTLKGSAQLFGCKQIGLLSHAMEAALDPIKHGNLSLSTRLATALHQGIDLIRSLCTGLASAGREPDFTAALKDFLPDLTDAVIAGFSTPVVPYPVAFLSARSEATELFATPHQIDRHQIIEQATKNPPHRSLLLAGSEAKPSAALAETPAKPQITSKAGSETIRVSVAVLDKLMNLAGELVLIRNRFSQHKGTNQGQDPNFTSAAQHLDQVTDELQNEIMKSRMQPLTTVFAAFHRTVRDLSLSLQKSVDLHLYGTETELDRTLLDAVRPPLLHLVRNCIDHGIESKEERKQRSKPESGRISIGARQEDGYVNIQVADDGRGFDPEKLVKRGIELGLLSENDVSTIEASEILNLAFAPGLSTVAKVSRVSGRGVGMDIVRNDIERIGGSVHIVDSSAQGTTIQLRIPLTLAIVPALIVVSGKTNFAIPQAKVAEIIRLKPNDPSLEELCGQLVCRRRGTLIPLVNLAQLLGNRDETAKGTEPRVEEIDDLAVVVVHCSRGSIGLIVDQILDSTDIVVKPMSSFVTKINAYSGAMVLADGTIGLTLDIEGLAKSSEAFKSTERTSDLLVDSRPITASDLMAKEYLVVRIDRTQSHALLLSDVDRLEEFSQRNTHRVGDQLVTYYRDAIMPLIDLRNCVARSTATHPGNKTMKTVVINRDNRSFGLVVDEINDIISTTKSVDTAITDRPEVQGVLQHGSRLVAVINVPLIVENCRHHRINRHNHRETMVPVRILVVEDNLFFRSQIDKILTSAGFTVVCKPDGKQAFDHLMQTGDHYNLVVSDIEMPQMDGYQLATKVRAESRYKNLPLIALTTKTQPRDIENGRRAGFNRQLAKLDSTELVNTVHEFLLAEGA